MTAAREWTPYGVEVGGPQPGLGYAGEWFDAAVGLQYLRARWYAPKDAIFVSRDPIESELPYLYVRGNPVNRIDPSGWAPYPPRPLDHRDLTSWLARELRANSNSPEVNQILEYNTLASQVHAARKESTRLNDDLDLFAWALETALSGIAANDWKQLVEDGARWDFKDQIYDKLIGSEDERETIMLCHVSGCEWFEYSVPGNIHYGYVGRAAGFSSDTLHLGAGVAEITDPAHRQEIERLGKWFVNIPLKNICLFDFEISGIYVNFEWWQARFDDPVDYAAVELGSKLFDRVKSNVSRGDFEILLHSYSSQLMHMPVPTEPYFNPAWPYPLGYFDGGEK